MASLGLSLREASWSAVAAATAFLALALARLRDESMAEGGSCSYSTAGFAGMKGAHTEFRPTKHDWFRLWRAVLQTAHAGQPVRLQRPPAVIK